MIDFVRKQILVVIFGIVVFALLGMAASQMAARVPFRWDLFCWSESPFMTNLLKLDDGQPIYTSPEQANSFVYSPGLEYLTYALLKPFGRQLDIRYCRVVSIGFAIIASLAFMRSAILLSRAAFGSSEHRLFAPVAAALFFLVIYHNFTADVTHPDNLYIFHAAVTLWLTFEAIARPAAWRSVAAILFAAMGVYVKQMAGLSSIGVGLVLVATAPRKLRAAAWLLPLASAATASTLGCLWAMGWVKFYTYDVLVAHADHHGIRSKLPELLALLFQTYRALPLLLGGIAIVSGLRSRNRTVARFLIAYLVLGVIEVAPSVLAYLKPMGSWNNLTIIEVWATLPVVPLLLQLMRGDAFGPSPRRELAWLAGFSQASTLALALAFAFVYVPGKFKPEPGHYAHCQAIQDSVEQDLKSGKRVLVAHGAMFQILGGSRKVPLDRSNSILELFVAGKEYLTGTGDRIRAHYYDKIYVNSPFYSKEILATIQANYQNAGYIPGKWDYNKLEFGSNMLTCDTFVWARR